MAALFRAYRVGAAACRVAVAACRAVPAPGACGRDVPAVPVLGASARVLGACGLAQGVPAGDVRRWLLRVLLPVQDDCRVAVSRPGQGWLGGCPAAADDPGRVTRVAASRRDNWRDSRRLDRTTAEKIVSPSLWFPFQVLEERRKGRRFQGQKAKPCVDLPALDAVSWRTGIGGRSLPPGKTAFAAGRGLRREGNPL
jgi:hypothetical protein